MFRITSPRTAKTLASRQTKQTNKQSTNQPTNHTDDQSSHCRDTYRSRRHDTNARTHRHEFHATSRGKHRDLDVAKLPNKSRTRRTRNCRGRTRGAQDEVGPIFGAGKRDAPRPEKRLRNEKLRDHCRVFRTSHCGRDESLADAPQAGGDREQKNAIAPRASNTWDANASVSHVAKRRLVYSRPTTPGSKRLCARNASKAADEGGGPTRTLPYRRCPAAWKGPKAAGTTHGGTRGHHRRRRCCRTLADSGKSMPPMLHHELCHWGDNGTLAKTLPAGEVGLCDLA